MLYENNLFAIKKELKNLDVNYTVYIHETLLFQSFILLIPWQETILQYVQFVALWLSPVPSSNFWSTWKVTLHIIGLNGLKTRY